MNGTVNETLSLDTPLPVGSAGKLSSGWFGLIAMIVTEAALFGYLLFAYFYLYAQNRAAWPPDGMPDLRIPAINTVLLLGSSVLAWRAERAVKSGRQTAALVWTATAFIAGTLFALIQLGEWHKKTYGLTSHVYGSLYFTITGFHLAHVVVGLGILLLLMVWIALGYIERHRHAAFTIGVMYWHFVDAVWLAVFTSLYLTPYIFKGMP
jgi:cytochrome c oxidase subunit 3